MPAINIRNIDLDARARLNQAARARDINLGAYIVRLGRLHDSIRAMADAGDGALQAELVGLGLETVRGAPGA